MLGPPRPTQLLFIGHQYSLNRVYQQVEHYGYDMCYVPDRSNTIGVCILGEVKNVELGGYVELYEDKVKMRKGLRVQFLGASTILENTIHFSSPQIKELSCRFLFDSSISSYPVEGYIDYLDKSARIYMEKVFIFENMFDFMYTEGHTILSTNKLLQYE